MGGMTLATALREAAPPKSMPRYLARIRCTVDEAHELLKGWPLYAATGEMLRQPFSEGGSIDHTGVPTEAGFARGAREYADLADVVVNLPELEGLCVVFYWKQEKNQHDVREEVQRGYEKVGTAIFYGTLWTACGLTHQSEDALYKEVEDWIEDRKSGKE